jgi:glycosyltransferase involved in cell wall biosynthesis
VYATSPPLFVGAVGLAAARIRRVPFVFEVRDIWPESAIALGELTNPRAILAAESLERLLYRSAKRVVAVTQGIEARLVKRGMAPSKIEHIPNGANTELFRFSEAGRRSTRQAWGVDDKFVAMYAGIHGIAQGLETVLKAAELLREQADIRFVLVGEGPRKPDLARMVDDLALRNVTMLPEVASAEMPSYLSAADCAIVPLKREPIFRGALPSKMFEAWSCSLPVLLSVEGEADTILNAAGGGISCMPEDPEALASAIRSLASDRAEARAMGARGRAYVAGHYSRQEQARALEELLLAVVDEN